VVTPGTRAFDNVGERRISAAKFLAHEETFGGCMVFRAASIHMPRNLPNYGAGRAA
jgi:hypothetical protein